MVIFYFPHYFCIYKLEFFYKEDLFSLSYLVMYVYMYSNIIYTSMVSWILNFFFALQFNNIIHFLT